MLREASTASLAVVLLVVSVTVGIALVGFTPGFLASEWGAFFPSRPDDDDAFAARRIFQLRRGRPNGLVVAVGSSATRRILGPRESLREQILRTCPGVEDFAKLTTSAQSLWASGAILCELPPGSRFVAVLGLAPLPMGGQDDDLEALLRGSRLGFRSDFLVDEGRRRGMDVPRGSGLWAVDNRAFLLSRLTLFLENVALQRRFEWKDKASSPVDPLVEGSGSSALSGFRPSAVSRARAFRQAVNARMRTLERVVDRCVQGPERTAVLVENPLQPDFVARHVGLDRYAAHLDRMRRWSSERGFVYAVPSEDLGLTGTEFEDEMHVIRSKELELRLRSYLVSHVRAAWSKVATPEHREGVG